MKSALAFTITLWVLLGSCTGKALRQDKDTLLAKCEANKDKLAGMGYTGSCEDIIKQLAADNQEQILAAISAKKSRSAPPSLSKWLTRRQDKDTLLAKCEANKDQLAGMGYTGSCEEIIKQVAADNQEQIIAAMSAKKSRAAPPRRQDKELIAKCEDNKEQLAGMGYTGICEDIIKQVAADNKTQILSAMKSKQSRFWKIGYGIYCLVSDDC